MHENASFERQRWYSSQKRGYCNLPSIFRAFRLVVPDNCKTGVTRGHRYDPDLNPTYYNFAAHCGFSIVPARPYRPKDKAKVENTVQVAQRWVVARCAIADSSRWKN